MLRRIFIFILLIVTFDLMKFIKSQNNSISIINKDYLNSTRDGRFLFDSLFGLEIEEELLNAAAQNTLKSCDCGM